MTSGDTVKMAHAPLSDRSIDLIVQTDVVYNHPEFHSTHFSPPFYISIEKKSMIPIHDLSKNRYVVLMGLSAAPSSIKTSYTHLHEKKSLGLSAC
jgi:hypothetical protein